jgi:serine/threonine protein kinase
MGFCYCDISFGNVFIDPGPGEVLICDNDNVVVDGSFRGGVLGTPRFMAPEIVRGEACPTSQTDLYSLSVLLFYIFLLQHPLDGAKEASIKCFDYPAMTMLYGTEPIFIFDPDDQSNRPDRRYHSNALEYWAVYPTFLKELFTRAFTDGIRDPLNGRVRESEWRSAMARLQDSILYCGDCGAENFYDELEFKRSGGIPSVCWQCKRTYRLPPRIRIEKSVVMLNHDTTLFQHHIDHRCRYDFSTPVAEVARHPSQPGIWGLKNLSAETWVATSADGSVTDVEPGRSITLASETRINFGHAEGAIRCT